MSETHMLQQTFQYLNLFYVDNENSTIILTCGY